MNVDRSQYIQFSGSCQCIFFPSVAILHIINYFAALMWVEWCKSGSDIQNLMRQWDFLTHFAPEIPGNIDSKIRQYFADINCRTCLISYNLVLWMLTIYITMLQNTYPTSPDYELNIHL